MHPFSQLGVNRLCCGFAVPPCTVRFVTQFACTLETTESREPEYGYKFGQEERTYKHRGGPRLFRRLNLPVRLPSTTAAACTSARPPGRGGICSRPGRQHDGLQPQRLQLKTSSVSNFPWPVFESLWPTCSTAPTVRGECQRNAIAHNFPLDPGPERIQARALIG